jgi:GT2 family glycosyltransferase
VRPTVSVVLPFLGDAAAAREVVARLGGLRTSDGDELIVADNTSDGVVEAAADTAVRVVRAAERRSASYARNAAAATASGEWLLFLDADCLFGPDLLDAFFKPPPDERCGIVAGEIVGDPEQTGTLARWSRSRRGRWVERLLAGGMRPAGVTANLLVRREAFETAAGFRLGGGADFDLSWRLQDAGWELEHRPRALVRHRDRETLREVGEQARAYGSHVRNLRRLHGADALPPVALRSAPRALGAAAIWRLRGQRGRARLALVDAFYFANAWAGAHGAGPRRRSGD